MRVYIDNEEVEKKYVSFRELGFRESLPETVESSQYAIVYSKREFVSLMDSRYSYFVEETKTDDEASGEPDPPFLLEMGYPALDVLIDKNAIGFQEIFREYLCFDLLELSLSGSKIENYLYVINSIDEVKLVGSDIKISGEVYKIKKRQKGESKGSY